MEAFTEVSIGAGICAVVFALLTPVALKAPAFFSTAGPRIALVVGAALAVVSATFLGYKLGAIEQRAADMLAANAALDASRAELVAALERHGITLVPAMDIRGALQLANPRLKRIDSDLPKWALGAGWGSVLGCLFLIAVSRNFPDSARAKRHADEERRGNPGEQAQRFDGDGRH